jgi:hypothetical protein
MLFELQAGILTLREILDYNKKVLPIEVQFFFVLMEVYGSGTELNLSNSLITDYLINLRQKSSDTLTTACHRLEKKLIKIKKSGEDLKLDFKLETSQKERDEVTKRF